MTYHLASGTKYTFIHLRGKNIFVNKRLKTPVRERAIFKKITTGWHIMCRYHSNSTVAMRLFSCRSEKISPEMYSFRSRWVLPWQWTVLGFELCPSPLCIANGFGEHVIPSIQIHYSIFQVKFPFVLTSVNLKQIYLVNFN